MTVVKNILLTLTCMSLAMISACSDQGGVNGTAAGRSESGLTRVRIGTPNGEIGFSSDQPCISLPDQRFFQFTERATQADDGETITFIAVLSSGNTLRISFNHAGSRWATTDTRGDQNVSIDGKRFSFKGEAAVFVDMKRDRSEEVDITITCP